MYTMYRNKYYADKKVNDNNVNNNDNKIIIYWKSKDGKRKSKRIDEKNQDNNNDIQYGKETWEI